MANNYSHVHEGSSIQINNYRMIIIQVLVVIFLCINFVQLITFIMKDIFYRTMRYILFANTLLADCITLILSNVLVLQIVFEVAIQMWVCLILYAVSSLYFYITLVTLTAMAVERYVAICMPLHHGDLCSTHRALHSILIIHALSSIPFIVVISVVLASATLRYKEYTYCTAETVVRDSWQRHLRFTISQFYFLIICIIIIFCYVRIMKVAKVASGESKKSTSKGLKTVVLHTFQLLLCLIQLWCPLIENAILQIDVMVSVHIRYFNYIVFLLAPRCLSPLIYGIRDEKFVRELKNYVLCGLYRKRLVQQL